MELQILYERLAAIDALILSLENYDRCHAPDRGLGRAFSKSRARAAGAERRLTLMNPPSRGARQNRAGAPAA